MAAQTAYGIEAEVEGYDQGRCAGHTWTSSQLVLNSAYLLSLRCVAY